MNRVFKALVPTILLTEIADLTFMTATWAILAELHFPNSVIFGGEAVTLVGIVIIGITIFRRAYWAEGRIAAEDASAG